MSLHLLDWIIVVGFILSLTLVALYTKKLVKSVADFLVAGRCASRYLLTTVSAVNFLGAATIIANFQVFYDAGFTAVWWYQMLIPITMVVTLSGWVIYRWRATRVLTQAQLFELRYSKKYRIFAGILSFFTGLMGLSIVPPVATRFLISLCNFPETFNFMGLGISTYYFTMIALLAVTLLFTYLGGQITVMVTDFIQGMLCMIVFMAIFCFIVVKIPWSQLIEGLSYAPKDASLIHPFHASDIKTYNIWFFIWSAFGVAFLFPTHGMQQPTACAAKNPHEAHMAWILSSVRYMAVFGALTIVPICAYVLLNHPDFSHIAENVSIAIQDQTEQVQREVRVPVAVSYLLPTGLMGAFVAVILAAFISTNDSYFLMSASIFIQDVILPFRKKPFDPKTHLRLLRISIPIVVLLILLIGILFESKQDIQMFWALILALQAGMSAIPMLGALYWKRATTFGAWVSAVTGIVLGTIGFYISQNIEGFPLNGAQLAFIAVLLTATIFVIASLIDGWYSKKPAFNLDKLLHRGKYSIDNEEALTKTSKSSLLKILKIDKNFTRGDKIIYFSIMGWSLLQTLVLVVGILINIFVDTSDKGWALFWKIHVWTILLLSIVVTVWLSIGGIRNMFELFSQLKKEKVNTFDDGMVIDHTNAVELQRSQQSD